MTIAPPPPPGVATPPASAARTGHRTFPDVPLRNTLQARMEIPLLVRLLRLTGGGRVLEVGCGRGVALPVLHELLRPRRLVGLDIDAALLEHARAAAPAGAEVVHGDVHLLPFPAASFDLVIDFGTCYHIARPADALREIARVLRPGGRFVHETRISQLLAHPIRAGRRRLPWSGGWAEGGRGVRGAPGWGQGGVRVGPGSAQKIAGRGRAGAVPPPGPDPGPRVLRAPASSERRRTKSVHRQDNDLRGRGLTPI